MVRKPPFVFSGLRMASNLDRIRQWRAKPEGLQIIGHEWERFTRVIKVEDQSRGRKIKLNRFTSVFYRLREEAVGHLNELGQSWSLRLAEPLPERSVPTKVKRDFTSRAITGGSFFSVPKDGDGGVHVYCLVRWWSGHEKLVDSGDAADRRDVASVLKYGVWKMKSTPCLA